jgi:hypothetical protein
VVFPGNYSFPSVTWPPVPSCNRTMVIPPFRQKSWAPAKILLQKGDNLKPVSQDQIIDILSRIFARAKLFFFILRLNKCLHVLYVFVWGHGGVSHLRMSLLWPWHLTIMSGKFYHTKCHILSVHVYELKINYLTLM